VLSGTPDSREISGQRRGIASLKLRTTKSMRDSNLVSMKHSITHKRVSHNPQMGFTVHQNAQMKRRQPLGEILATNLNRLMENHPVLKSNKALGAREGLSTGTVGRVRNGEVSPTLETVEAIANAFGVSPMDLFRGAESGQLGPLTTTETMLVVLFRSLPEEVQRRIILSASNPPAPEPQEFQELGELKESFLRANHEEREAILDFAKDSIGGARKSRRRRGSGESESQ